jgi:hypothetical protein
MNCSGTIYKYIYSIYVCMWKGMWTDEFLRSLNLSAHMPSSLIQYVLRTSPLRRTIMLITLTGRGAGWGSSHHSSHLSTGRGAGWGSRHHSHLSIYLSDNLANKQLRLILAQGQQDRCTDWLVMITHHSSRCVMRSGADRSLVLSGPALAIKLCI